MPYRFAQYTYITYLGLNGMSSQPLVFLLKALMCACMMLALPFLVRTRLILFPLIPTLLFYVVSLLGLNISREVLTLYF